MKALFIELPAFERYRQDYLDDQEFNRFQNLLAGNPETGDVIDVLAVYAKLDSLMPNGEKVNAVVYG